jgi:glutamine amidotransferase
MISIVDYGMGNLRSVEKALEKLGCDTRVITAPEDVKSAQKLIVPGVGAFGDAMHGLAERGLVDSIREFGESGKPLLGICLGLQILFESSEEDPGVEGLNLLPGTVQRFVSRDLKIPHMGWNHIKVLNGSRLLSDLGPDPYVYFVHSYFVAPGAPDVAAATCDYGTEFVAAIERGSLFGTQFHPEKSQAVGLRILRNFANL